MNRYIIEKYQAYETVQFYTIRFEKENDNETDKFISRFTQSEEFKEDLGKIIYWIDKIGKTGALERHFRPEKFAVAIPIDSGYSLRFYCYRINDNVLILGNGGIKTSQKVQDSPDCLPHFDLMNHVAKKLYWSIKDNKTQVDGLELSGRLKFNY